jgi:hypothetical protein
MTAAQRRRTSRRTAAGLNAPAAAGLTVAIGQVGQRQAAVRQRAIPAVATTAGFSAGFAETAPSGGDMLSVASCRVRLYKTSVLPAMFAPLFEGEVPIPTSCHVSQLVPLQNVHAFCCIVFFLCRTSIIPALSAALLERKLKIALLILSPAIFFLPVP